MACLWQHRPEIGTATQARGAYCPI